MRNLMLTCLLAVAASGCTQADKDAINAAFAPIDQAWREQTDANPLLGVDMALSGLSAAHDVRTVRQLQRDLAR